MSLVITLPVMKFCNNYFSILDGEDIAFKMETAEQEKQREERKLKMKKKKKKLPYWMKYVAWCLLILTSFTSAFFVVLYGFQFGKEKSAQWISALTISFFQDVCVSQPIKILGLALFIALIVKKPAEEEDDQDGNSNKKQIDEEYLNKEGTAIFAVFLHIIFVKFFWKNTIIVTKSVGAGESNCRSFYLFKINYVNFNNSKF